MEMPMQNNSLPRKHDFPVPKLQAIDAKGVLELRALPDDSFTAHWETIVLSAEQRDQMLGQAIMNFTVRPKVDRSRLPLHGVILLVGPPGTGKTSIARGLASQTAKLVTGIGHFVYVEVEPHALASASLGKSQKAVQELLGQTVAELAEKHPLIVLLDEVETLAADRNKMSLEANPVDVHRATDAVLAQLDHLAAKFPHLLFIATSNFEGAIDPAFLSRADLIIRMDLPGLEARRAILSDTLTALAEAYPGVTLQSKGVFLDELAHASDGLDGRRLRKTVLAACASEKTSALDPSRLTAKQLERAVHSAIRALPNSVKHHGHSR